MRLKCAIDRTLSSKVYNLSAGYYILWDQIYTPEVFLHLFSFKMLVCHDYSDWSYFIPCLHFLPWCFFLSSLYLVCSNFTIYNDDVGTMISTLYSTLLLCFVHSPELDKIRSLCQSSNSSPRLNLFVFLNLIQWKLFFFFFYWQFILCDKLRAFCCFVRALQHTQTQHVHHI